MLFKSHNNIKATSAEDNREKDQKTLFRMIRSRAENLFASGQMMCSEAVMAVLNQGLGGGLPPEVAFKLSSSQSNGLGGRGCICGALNGGILALGLFFGRERPGFGNGRQVRTLAGQLHDRFKEKFGSTCCRVLTRKLEDDTGRQFYHCQGMTGIGAELAARIILENRSELYQQVDYAYLSKQESDLQAKLKIATGFFRSQRRDDA